MSKRSLQKLAAGKSRGFTLIELLIVISIIALLTIMAMLNYANVQRQARLDFAADSLVSAIKEQQVMARSGKVLTETESSGNTWKNQCFALKFVASRTSDNGVLATGQSDYVGLPDSTVPTAPIDSCIALTTPANWQSREIFDSGIKLISIKKDCTDISAQELYFKPPFGKIWSADPTELNQLLNAQFQFELSVPNQVDSNRFVQYNVNTGEVKRIEKDACKPL